MKNLTYGNIDALKEHMHKGNKVTWLEALSIFGVAGFSATLSRMRMEGYNIKSQRVPMIRSIVRLNKYCDFVPPRNLPTKEILVTEYWIMN